MNEVHNCIYSDKEVVKLKIDCSSNTWPNFCSSQSRECISTAIDVTEDFAGSVMHQEKVC